MLELRNLTKSYGALTVTDDVSIEIGSGELLSVIGPNGAGKTSLVAQIAGDIRPNSGTIRLNGRDVTSLTTPQRCRAGLSRTYQISSLFKAFSVLDNVRLAAQAHRGHSFRFWRPARADREVTLICGELVERVGLSSRRDTPVSELAHGEKRQLEIAMALASSPRVLLLDEPTAGMGPEDSARMSELIRSLKDDTSILLVEHDMPTVFSLADRIVVLVRGQVIFAGTPDECRVSDDVKRSYLGEGEEDA